MTNKVAVLGSINVDTTYHVDRFPLPGETISANAKSSAPGGKGANQAVAAARSGATTSFIGAVGNDSEGQYMLEMLKADQINVDHIATNNVQGTGTALITLDANGQNDIMVFGGANQAMTVADLAGFEAVAEELDFLVTQFETPQAVAKEAFKIAKQHDVVTVLNPAPAAAIDPELLQYTDVIAPNETESEVLTGIKVDSEAAMAKTAAYFKEQGVQTTLITLGEKGVYYSVNGTSGIVPAFKVKPVDTTAAGDTFIGGLVSQLKPDFSNVADAIKYAQRASSLTVQGMGAMPSIPTHDQVIAALNEN